MPTLDFDSMAAAAMERQPELFVNRRMVVTGKYDPAGDIVLRGRSSDGNPGVHLVTPLLVPHVPQALLVNRGWVPSPDAATVDTRPYAEPGTRTVVGLLMEVPRNTRAGGQPAETRVAGKRVTTWRRLDLDVLRRGSPRPILPLYLQQLPDSGAAATARPPVRVPPAELDNGPHLSYAVQWFSFAAIGIIGLVIVFVRNRRRPGA
jgi:surfeit locus 1 family protein